MGENAVDLYRDTPVRLLGYANELGESFRSLIHVNWVRLSYGIATAYVIADTYDKTKIANRAQYETEAKRRTYVTAIAADTLIWQTLASVIIPGFAINRICSFSGYALKKMPMKMPSVTRKWITAFIGLASIPIIYKPIDNMVDCIMDNTLRKILPASSKDK